MSKPIFRVNWKYKNGFGDSISGHIFINEKIIEQCPEALINIDKLNNLIKNTVMDNNKGSICDPYNISITKIEDLRGDLNGKENK